MAGGIRAKRWKFSTLTTGCYEDSRPLMTSSSMPDAGRTRYLLDLLSQVPDPRASEAGGMYWLGCWPPGSRR
ncbi:MAG TPA: hypothetical protein VF070_41900 [Streptosporangiaceae bacterium]